MPTLHGTVTFPKVNNLTMAVTEDLELDMARFFDVALNVDTAVTKGLLGFAPGYVVFLGEGNVVVSDPHAAPATTGDRFDDHRITNLTGDLNGFGLILDRTVGARDNGHTRLSNRIFRDGLITHHFDGF